MNNIKIMASISLVALLIFINKPVMAQVAGETATVGAELLLANPNCLIGASMPDQYYLGTGYSFSGACQAANIGVQATTAIAMAANSDLTLYQQIESLAQEVLTVQNLIIQTEELIRDIQENPLQVVVPDVNQIIKNQKRIEKLANEIDKGSSSVGSNLIKNLETPDTIGLGQGSRFQLWSESRKRAIDEGFDAVKAFVVDLKGENKTTSDVIKNLNGARGQRANARALSTAAGQQLTTLGKIEEALLKMLSLQSAEAGSRLEEEMERERLAALRRKKSKKFKIEDHILDDVDGNDPIGKNPSFFGIRSAK